MSTQCLTKKPYSPKIGDENLKSSPEMDKLFWQRDEDAKACTNCGKQFSLTRRRSHCRSCGFIFCSDCTSHKIQLPEIFKRKGEQKVCDNCYFYLISLQLEQSNEVIPQPDYEKATQDIYKQLSEIFSIDESKWKLTCEDKGVRVMKLQLPYTHIYCFRTTVIVDLPPNLVWKIYSQDKLWKNWQPELDTHVIESFSESSQVRYITYKFPIVESRDSCLYSFSKRGTFTHPQNTEAISLYSRTIDHPKCPQTKQFVRSFCSVSYTTLEPVKTENSDKVFTKVTSILHLDPKGLIPAFFVNFVLSTAVESVYTMKRWMESHAEEYSSDALL